MSVAEDITNLLQGCELSEAQICEKLQLDAKLARRELFLLTFRGELRRAAGLGKRPALYRVADPLFPGVHPLPTRRIQA